jgi:hypothetical protein
MPGKDCPPTRRHIPDEGISMSLLSDLFDDWDSEDVGILYKKQRFNAANRNPINLLATDFFF